MPLPFVSCSVGRRTSSTRFIRLLNLGHCAQVRRELFQSSCAVDDRDSDCEMEAEFGFENFLRIVVDQGQGGIFVEGRPEFARCSVGLILCRCAQVQCQVQRGMKYPGAGVELDRYAGSRKKMAYRIAGDRHRPGLGKRRKKPHGVIENIFRSGETVGSECRGNHAIFCCAPSV